MKIYFEDGKLINTRLLPKKPDFVVDASDGVNANMDFLDAILDTNPNCVVYTNSVFAFSNRYAWNRELKVPEIYIRSGEHALFTRIDKLTSRELREAHNIAKLYIAGEFEREGDCLQQQWEV